MVFSKYLVELGQKMFFLRNLYDLKKIQLKDILDTYTKYLKEQGESNVIKMYLKLVYKDVNDSEKPIIGELIKEVFKYLNYENVLEFERIHYFTEIFTDFENYLFNCFRYALLKHPEIIENRTISLQELKKLGGLNLDLINDILIENYIHDISYKGLKKYFDKARKPIGINHEINEGIIDEMCFLREIRHLYTHGNGTIDSLFLKKIERLNVDFKKLGFIDLKIGEKIEISEDLILLALGYIVKICRQFDFKFTEIYNEIKSEDFTKAFDDVLKEK